MEVKETNESLENSYELTDKIIKILPVIIGDYTLQESMTGLNVAIFSILNFLQDEWRENKKESPFQKDIVLLFSEALINLHNITDRERDEKKA